MNLPNLDPLLHSELRLKIMSILISVKKADFTYIKDKTEASAGNLSVQLKKLKKADYVKIEKSFSKNYPKTECIITPKGISAFEGYVKNIQEYLKKIN